jgi:hypothetical protein
VLQVLAVIVPLGLAGGVSPVMLTEVTVILAGTNGRLAGRRYATGAVLTLLIFVSLLVLLGRGIELPTEPHLDATLDIVIGVALLAFAGIVHSRQPSPRPHPAVQRAPRNLRPRQALGFGVFSMATNLTTLALVVPAAKEIAASDLVLAGRAVTIAVLVVLASIPAWLPLALTAAAPEPAARVLTAMGDVITNHGRRLSVMLVACFGLLLVLRGVLRVLGA